MLHAKMHGVLASIALLTSACPSKGDENFSAESSSSDSTDSSPGSSDPELCGDSISASNVYCYELHRLPEVIHPDVVVGLNIGGKMNEEFVAFASGTSIVRWEAGKATLGDPMKHVSLSGPARALAVNILGSKPDPDIFLTNIMSANLLPGMPETFGELEPLGLPEAALVDNGLTIPIDVGGEGTTEFLRGSGSRASLWRKPDSLWIEDEKAWEVPGCEVLVDFALGDFDGDGLTDVAYIGSAYNVKESTACADPDAHSVMIITQSEVGQLQEQPRISVRGRKFLQLHSGDFDGDGRSDVVVVTDTFDVLVFRAEGRGRFETPITLEPSLFLAVGNVDGDVSDEIVMFTKAQTTRISDEIFSGGQTFEWADFVGVPRALADLNGDGIDDIAFMEAEPGSSSLVVAISTP